MVRPALGSRDRELMHGGRAILGIDEVGRGSLVGPVVVCGALFDTIEDHPEVQDSKVMTARSRERTAEWLRLCARDWMVVEVWPELIDRINILQATRLAMRSVVHVLRDATTEVVVDGGALTGCAGGPVHHFPRADSRFFAVAAASILAKVHRDRLLVDLGRRYPGWGWESNKGYGSEMHRRALQERGSTFLHRQSFGWSPVLP